MRTRLITMRVCAEGKFEFRCIDIAFHRISLAIIIRVRHLTSSSVSRKYACCSADPVKVFEYIRKGHCKTDCRGSAWFDNPKKLG